MGLYDYIYLNQNKKNLTKLNAVFDLCLLNMLTRA